MCVRVCVSLCVPADHLIRSRRTTPHTLRSPLSTAPCPAPPQTHPRTQTHRIIVILPPSDCCRSSRRHATGRAPVRSPRQLVAASRPRRALTRGGARPRVHSSSSPLRGPASPTCRGAAVPLLRCVIRPDPYVTCHITNEPSLVEMACHVRMGCLNHYE